MTSVAYMDRILSRAGVRARRKRSPIFSAGGTSLETCSCRNFGSTVRPSVGAVLKASDRGNARTSAGIATVKALEQPLRHAGTVLPSAPQNCAHSERASEPSVTGLTELHVCNMPR